MISNEALYTSDQKETNSYDRNEAMNISNDLCEYVCVRSEMLCMSICVSGRHADVQKVLDSSDYTSCKAIQQPS